MLDWYSKVTIILKRKYVTGKYCETKGV